MDSFTALATIWSVAGALAFLYWQVSTKDQRFLWWGVGISFLLFLAVNYTYWNWAPCWTRSYPFTVLLFFLQGNFFVFAAVMFGKIIEIASKSKLATRIVFGLLLAGVLAFLPALYLAQGITYGFGDEGCKTVAGTV